MKKSFVIKSGAAAFVLLIGLIGFSFSYKSEMQSINPTKTPHVRIPDATGEIAGFKSWTQINKKPAVIPSAVSMQCIEPFKKDLDLDATNPHNEKFINVYVNDIGKDEMLTKKRPNFPVGTIIVKEKLPNAESKDAELLTVMIKREKNYNPKVGDWEFLTFNGAGTETTARGRLESCQTCHLVEKQTDYVSRRGYLDYEIRQKFK